MQSNYRRLGDYIRLVDERNRNLEVTNLVGLTINKNFIPSVANIVDTDMSTYKIIRKNQFACSVMQVRRDKKMPVALWRDEKPAIISQAYPIFEIVDEQVVSPDYLIMWFTRSEFDREACFLAVGGVRGSLEWEDFLNMKFPLPSLEQQKEIVAEYEAVEHRIQLNKKLCAKLEETAQTIYRHWFEDFEFPVPRHCEERGTSDEAISTLGYKSSGGEMVECEELGKEIPKGWRVGKLEEVAKIIMGQSPEGESYNQDGNGEIFYQGRTEFGFRFPSIKIFTTDPKRRAKKGEILMSVRAPVGDLNIATHDCCIGRGIASLNCKTGKNSFLFYLLLRVRNQFDVSNDEGTIFGSITKEDLHGIRVLIPNDSVRINFNNYIEIVDNKIKTTSLQTQKLEELKGLLLGKMAVEK